MGNAGVDRWADWLFERRFGGCAADAEARAHFVARLAPVRDEVLENAHLEGAQTLLDVGCGDGLIGFAALERGATVIFADISSDLLGACRDLAVRRGFEDRSDFLEASATDLSALDDASVDAVTTRSVLIYVDEKAQAFAEFFRVLRPGGWLSIYEPINVFARTRGWERRFWFYPSDGLADLAEKLSDVYRTHQDPEADPMFNFDERDLMRLAEEAGFFPVELQLRVEVKAAEPCPWEIFLHSSGNPNVPTFAEAMEEVLSPAERNRVSSHLRPLVEEGRGVSRMAHAYLSAGKPAFSDGHYLPARCGANSAQSG
jgi:ubiquinone/menaquinone biosynthesis C-methylase UbiE